MNVLSILGGLFLLLLGICGVGTCLSSRSREPYPKVAVTPAPLPVPEAVREAFPERLGAWTRTRPPRVYADGSMDCAYDRGGMACRVALYKATPARILRAYGKDLADVPAPVGWRFFRQVSGGGFLAGLGDWALDDEVWVSRGLAGRLNLETASPEAAEDFLKEIPLGRLEAALQAL